MVKTLFVAIHFADDTVGIMQMVLDDGKTIKRPVVTPADIDAEIARSAFDADKLPVQGWRILPGGQDDVPADRTFRDAWTWRDGAVTHDMARAKEMQRDRIREARKDVLNAADYQQLSAITQGDTKAAAEIETRKQTLRDLPTLPAIAEASTIDELKAAWPGDLL